MDIGENELLSIVRQLAGELRVDYRNLDQKVDKLKISQAVLKTKAEERSRHNGAVYGLLSALAIEALLFVAQKMFGG